MISFPIPRATVDQSSFVPRFPNAEGLRHFKHITSSTPIHSKKKLMGSVFPDEAYFLLYFEEYLC